LVIDTSGVPDLPETIAGGGTVAVSSKGMVVLQAMAAVHEPVHQGQAAADVPTIAPVPVPLRAESGATISDTEPEPIEPEGSETQASEPDQPAGQGLTAAPVRTAEQSDAAPAKPKATRRKKK
jgi:hypothetical protein